MKGKETNRRNIELKLVKLIAKESKIKESKITADGDCSLEIKRRLLLGRKVMTNLDSILKSRELTLPTEVRLVCSVPFSHLVVFNSL